MARTHGVQQPDFYLATFSDIHGLGGGVAVVEGLGAALRDCGLSTLLLGAARQTTATVRQDPSVRRLNLRGDVPAWLWRVRHWLVPRVLTASLRQLPPPRRAFVGVNPLWVVGARRAWPDVPVAFVFVALLSNCLPFTWGRRPTLWQRISLKAVRRTERRALRLADQIIAPTRQAREELEAFCPDVRGRIAVCTYGCQTPPADPDLRARQRRTLGLGAADVMLLAIGVCDRNKGFDLALREMRQVDRRARLFLIGAGPQRRCWQQLAAEAGLEDRVRLVEPQPALAPWYAAADCVLSTSHYDTFPYVVLEAMCCGRPVVVPRHAPPLVYSGVAELIRENGGGALYDRTRPGALADCLNRLVRDAELRVGLGRAARETALRSLRWDRCVQTLLSVAGVAVGGAAPGRTPAARPLPMAGALLSAGQHGACFPRGVT